ncbi:NAD(P)-dependent alcohol dehydrogenase [Kutzneria sp. CA-103260]|uniref:NAD(P)-dependent alcohol dehydrogenase n=1 Tax=Kutzneria sp. CA-103260 TaxID=2802641 RepID=UPI001BA5443B|nr:NAD(P)-dependent alcohol dehydrogenase [Kutzneria sp. CA-103260]QUQ63830.1 oxidoreductase [Kutzneria sp. CA-103260]
MKALRLERWQSDPVLTEVAEPRPGPGQVVVRVGAAGACHSDLHLIREFGPGQVPFEPPFTLGHENAGWIHELGPGVTDVEVGQAVAVYGPWGCGTCARCRLGIEQYCENRAGGSLAPGLGGDGGMAELLLVPSTRHLIPLPAGLDPVTAAPLTDAALTPYHAIRRSWPTLFPGATAVVIGIGGLGHLAVQILRATTAARVIAVDTRAEALALAERAGADHTLTAGADTAQAIRELTDGRGADVIFDCVGNAHTVTLGAAASRMMGDLTIIGLGGGALPVRFGAVPHELSVQTTYWGSRPELEEVLDLAARGRLHAEITTFPLDDAAEAYRRLEAGEITGRAVIVPA